MKNEEHDDGEAVESLPAASTKESVVPPADAEAMEAPPAAEEPAAEMDVDEGTGSEDQVVEKGAEPSEAAPAVAEPEPAQDDDKPKAPLTYAQTVSCIARNCSQDQGVDGLDRRCCISHE